MKNLRTRLQTFITREHTLEVSAERLTRIIGRHGSQQQSLVTDAIDTLALTIVPRALIVAGRFHRERWTGQFHVRLRPTQVIWNPQRHTLFFELLDHDIQFDRSMRGVLASIGVATVNGLFGKNFIFRKTVAAMDGNQVLFELDHLSPRLQPLLEAVTLHRIECVQNALQVCFSTHPRKALQSVGRLAMGWLRQPADR